MKPTFFIFLTFTFFLGGQGLGQVGQNDEERIQGTWNVVSVAARGPKNFLSPEALKGSKFVFTAGKVKMQFGKQVFESGYRIDSAKKPKTIDLIEDSKKDGKVAPGIYVLEGDELKLCWDASCKLRPATFSKMGEVGQDLRLVLLKRDKIK